MALRTYRDLADTISKRTGKHRQKVIAIDGGGGAGKSTFAQNLSNALPGSVVIHIDDFYVGPWNKRLDHTDYDINPFFDWERFRKEVLDPISAGEPITYGIYDWHADAINTHINVPEDAVVIIEGSATTQHAFADLYDFTVWVEAPEDVRLTRALVRDGEHMRFLWEEDWLPVERNYIRVHAPSSRADVVVDGTNPEMHTDAFSTLP